MIFFNFREPHVAIKLDTGEVYVTKCDDCQQERLGKCGHTSAMLFLLEDMTHGGRPELFQSTTDTPAYWMKPGLLTKRNPKAAGENDYQAKIKDNRYKSFDPIPADADDLTDAEIDSFLSKCLQNGSEARQESQACRASRRRHRSDFTNFFNWPSLPYKKAFFSRIT